MKSREVFIVGMGLRHLLMAVSLIKSIRQHNPYLSVTLVVTEALVTTRLEEYLAGLYVKLIPVRESAEKNRIFKIAAFSLTNADEVMYIDADCLVYSELRPVFDLLETFDFLVRFNFYPATTFNTYKFKEGHKSPFLPHFNGGVWLFKRCNSVAKFFEDWQSYFNELGNPADQPSLVSAIINNYRSLAIGPLPSSYNVTPVYSKALKLAHTEQTHVEHYGISLRHARHLGEIASDLAPMLRVSVYSLVPALHRRLLYRFFGILYPS
jgi:hypothetical protein